MKFWKHGQKTKLAGLAGVSRQYLSDIVGRRRGVSYDMARRLEEGCKALEIKDMSVLVWLNNREVKHPAFKKAGKA